MKLKMFFISTNDKDKKFGNVSLYVFPTQSPLQPHWNKGISAFPTLMLTAQIWGNLPTQPLKTVYNC